MLGTRSMSCSIISTVVGIRAFLWVQRIVLPVVSYVQLRHAHLVSILDHNWIVFQGANAYLARLCQLRERLLAYCRLPGHETVFLVR